MPMYSRGDQELDQKQSTLGRPGGQNDISAFKSEVEFIIKSA